MVRFISVVAVAGLALTTSAIAGDKKEEEEVKDPDAITCKYMKTARSRIPERVCRTNFQWEELKREQTEAKRSNRNRNSSCGAVRC